MVQSADVLTNTDWLQWFNWPGNGQSLLADSTDVLQLKGVPVTAFGLQDRMVAVVGLGAVGAPAFCELARAGVGTLIGVDIDHYGEDSWVTQPIRRGLDHGRSKAELQGGRAHEINPAVHVITIRGLGQHVPYWIFRNADLILIAADNLEVLVWLGTLAQSLGKSLIQGAVHGESWLAIVRCFDSTTPTNPCPGCGLGAREWAMLRSRAGCDPNTLREQGIESTRTLRCVCATAAHFVVSEALKRLFGIEQNLTSEELAYCLLSHKSWRTHFVHNLDCRCPHSRWTLNDLTSSPEETTLSMLIDQAGLGASPLQVRSELPWASFSVCQGCQNHTVPVRCFIRPGSLVGKCRCGEPLVVSPIGVRSILPPEDLLRCRDLPLSRLGLGPGCAVGISVGEEWTYFFVGSPELPARSIAQTKEHHHV